MRSGLCRLCPLMSVMLMTNAVCSDAAPSSAVREVFDLIDRFDEGRGDNALDIAVRRPGRAGGAARDAIFLHPRDENDATLTFEAVELPAVQGGDRLVWLTALGVSDGFDPEEPDNPFNGVRFAMEADGQRVAEAVLKEQTWRPVAADLTPWAGKSVTLRLATNSIEANSNYDWAMFGEPRVVKLEGDELAGDARQGTGTGGIVLMEHQPVGAGRQAVVTVRALDQGGEALDAAVKQDLAHSLVREGQGLAAIEFDFGNEENAAGFRVELPEDGPRIAHLSAHTYQPQLEVVSVSADRAVAFAGERIGVRASVRNLGRCWLLPEHGARLTLELPAELGGDRLPARLERLGSRATEAVSWELALPAEAPETVRLLVSAEVAGEPSGETTGALQVFPRPPRVTGRPSEAATAGQREGAYVLENAHCRVVFLPPAGEPVLYYVRRGNRWRRAATSAGLATLVWNGPQGRVEGRLLPETARWDMDSRGERASLTFRGIYAAPGDDVRWTVAAALELDGDSPRVSARYSLACDAERELLRWTGPLLNVGDGTTGEKKEMALFPGLEMLIDDEPSSSERDAHGPLAKRVTPHPYKITMGLMSVRTPDALVALMWDPRQQWDGEHDTPTAIFGSPNATEPQANHVLGLSIPAIPDWLTENEFEAGEPYVVSPGRKLSLVGQIVLDGDPQPLGGLDHYYAAYGVPEPAQPPRDFEAELALSRYGFLQTVWDEETQKSRHCVDWATANAPGFATLLLFDSYLAKDNAGAQAARERAELIARNTIRDAGPGGLIDTACCHILRWELPFHYGYLEQGLEAARGRAYGAIHGQEADGGWGYHPDEKRASLGKRGDKVLGTCAGSAYHIWRYARLTGDPVCLEAGTKALEFMTRFRVPRGAQGWECPLYEPDILASGYAVAAYVEAYRITQKQEYLDAAIYWAKTGLPFCFHWRHADRPGMLYATIPVFGTTFYTHSWFGVPVQWCGLVYAYHLQHLAEFDDSFDWEKVARGITVSGEWQQFGDEEPRLKGTYPDGFYGWCTDRKPPFINPEDIILNRLALEGYDPEPSTAIVSLGDSKCHISSGAKVGGARYEDGTLRFGLSYFPGQTSHTVVTFLARPEAVEVNGEALAEARNLEEVESGWRWSEKNAYLLLKTPHAKRDLSVVVRGANPGQPPTPPKKTSWEFNAPGDAEGWAGHATTQPRVVDGALTCQVTLFDPWVEGPAVSFSAAEHPQIKLRVRASAGEGGALYWRTSTGVGWNAAQHVDFPMTIDAQFHDYTVDLSDHPAWRGNVLQLRFDLEPAECEGAEFGIDYLRATER